MQKSNNQNNQCFEKPTGIKKTRRKRKRFTSKKKNFYDISKFDPEGTLTGFIGGIPVTCTKNEVLEVLFREMNKENITRFELIGRNENQLNMGFGFATMSSQEKLRELCERRIEVMGKILDIRPAKNSVSKKSNNSVHSNRIILKNLSPNFDQNDLKTLLKENRIEASTSYLVMDFKTGLSKKVAVVDLKQKKALNFLLKIKSIFFKGQIIQIEKYDKLKRKNTQKNYMKNSLNENVENIEDLQSNQYNKYKDSCLNDLFQDLDTSQYVSNKKVKKIEKVEKFRKKELNPPIDKCEELNKIDIDKMIQDVQKITIPNNKNSIQKKNIKKAYSDEILNFLEKERAKKPKNPKTHPRGSESLNNIDKVNYRVSPLNKSNKIIFEGSSPLKIKKILLKTDFIKKNHFNKNLRFLSLEKNYEMKKFGLNNQNYKEDSVKVYVKQKMQWKKRA